MIPIARTEAILIEPVGDELIVYDRVARKAHRLNPTAAFLWRNCDGIRSTTALSKLLHREMGLPEDTDLVLLALESLEKQRLIKSNSSAHKVSRRDVMKRLRAVGVAAAMLPIVATVAAPPPTAAASRVPTAQDPSAGIPDFWSDTSKTGPAKAKDKGLDPLAPWR
jgi:hypothetical protein